MPLRCDYGGAVYRKRRKTKRPFDADQALHVTMRSSRATGDWSFQHRRNKGTIHLLVLDTAERYGIKIHRWENVFNHLHFLIEVADREDLKAFLRVLPQRIMFAVTGARKGSPKGRFFDQVAWSRITCSITSGRTLLSRLDSAAQRSRS